MVKKSELKKILNLNIVDILNRCELENKLKLPQIKCNAVDKIDYIASYSNLCEYHKTDNTCLAFYEYDLKFDGIKGVYNSIYYNDVSNLKKFKDRFKGVKYAISPDYSLSGDMGLDEQIYRISKARRVSARLTLECDILVIPNFTYSDELYFKLSVLGIEDTEVIAFGLKGSLKERGETDLLIKAIAYAVDNLKKLKQIIIYSDSIYDQKIIDLFNYAISHEIQIVIPNNKLKLNNLRLKNKRGTV